MYSVALEKFAGPLDTLLGLVEEEKLSINEISLSQIADQYILYLKSLEEMPKEELAAFLVIASTLILIKSRSLLPDLKITEEEEMDIKDLTKRLKMYKFFKELSLRLREMNKQGKHLFGREAYIGMNSVFFPPRGIGAQNLAQILKEILTAIPQADSLPEDSIKKIVSLEEKMDELKGRLEKMISFNFSDFGGEKRDKIEIIVGFLALLELVRQGFAIFEQKGVFANIELKKNE